MSLQTQLDLLWKYHEFDSEVDRYEAKMRNDPNRKKLIKDRTFLSDQQTLMKKVENDVSAMADRMEAVKDEYIRLESLLSDQATQLEENPPVSLEELTKQKAALQRTTDSLVRYEQELQKMRKDSEQRDRQQHEIRVRAAKVKAEYDAVRLKYEVDYKEQTIELNRLKAKADSQIVGIDPDLIKKYRDIKLHSAPPMAVLDNDRCGGCNMSLPSYVLHEIRSGSKIIECDNCNRILFVPTKEDE